MAGGGSRRRVALTFDMEHPSRKDNATDSPARLLDVLAQHDVRSTFFVQGRWARSHPDVARRVPAEGHLVGSHSHFHAPMPLLSDDGIRADLAQARDALVEVVDRDPVPWFRCPFGAGHDDARVLAVLRDEGYRDVHWDVDGVDWAEGRTSDQVRDAVVTGVREGPTDAIVLMHTWPAVTPTATAEAILLLADDGVDFVTVDELVDPTTGK